ncbi:hypothetical protein A3850_011535 [Lewinella sp. 4G2]|nr:hypothetical protein A3850_011535 [Lewinella sp. 4G2]
MTDESLGVVSGKLIPNKNYEEIRNAIWSINSSSSTKKFNEFNRLRINCQLENEVFLFPLSGFLIRDLEELPNEELEFQAVGNYRHVIEDNFLVNPPKERIFEPWEFITIEQKISYEDELLKEIGIGNPKGILNFLNSKSHKLSKYSFNAMAKSSRNDDVLFTVNEKGENKFEYAVVHLTWKSKFEENDNYPIAEFFEDFDHFLNYRMYPDKRDWEE